MVKNGCLVVCISAADHDLSIKAECHFCPRFNHLHALQFCRKSPRRDTMNAQDQADNLQASSIGPIPSLNDFDPTNHTVRERPEDLNQHDLDLRKNQEELSPSKLGRNYLRPPVYARKSGSRKNYLRLVYARKARKRFLPRAIGRRRDEKTSCIVLFWDLNSKSWVGTRSIAEKNPDENTEVCNFTLI